MIVKKKMAKMFQKISVDGQKITAVILAGRRDFGRCPLASRLIPALWPVAGRPVLERLLTHLADEGIRRAVICSGSDGSVLADSIRIDDRIEVTFLDEELPVGTAGCIRDAVNVKDGTLVLVFPAGIVNPPKVDALIKAHKEGCADLTMMFNPGDNDGGQMGRVSGIYVCDPSVIKYIPEAGYADIKEGLVPAMLRNGSNIHAAVLEEQAGNFRDSQEYLFAVSNMLINNPKLYSEAGAAQTSGSKDVFISTEAIVEPSARIYGPVVVMDDARISGGAVVLGPTVLGKKVSVGEGSIVINSVLWEGSRVGSNSQVQCCILDYHAVVDSYAAAERESVLNMKKGSMKRAIDRTEDIIRVSAGMIQEALKPYLDKVNGVLPEYVQINRSNVMRVLAPFIVLIAFIWSYKSSFEDLWNIWQRSDEYSSGLLVPFLVLYILWSRRKDIGKCSIQPSIIWGLLAFLGAQAVRLFGLYFMWNSAERLSIILSVAALVILLFGWRIFLKVGTVLLFLCLMLPLPNQVQAWIAQPLQRWATSSAVFCLETVGYEVMREGNIIHIGQSTVAVAEACNGLRMVTAFFVTSGLVVLLVDRTWWEKLIILISSLPIALLCNTIRLSVTAIFFTILEGEQWEKLFHDFGGYAMMPLALAIIVLELWLLTKLTSLPEKQEAIIITRNSS